MTSISVHFLPSLTTPDELAGGTVVMIDILRASTTITHALAAGAKVVIPCGEVEEARQLAAKLPGNSCVLGGERKGLPIEGFTFGNSPQDYTSSAVAGKQVIFTTTNGTAALLQCRSAAKVFIGAFVNLSAIVARIQQEESIHLLCAGTGGQITREDVLFAGALTQRLITQGAGQWSLNDQARIAVDAWITSFIVDGQPIDPTPESLAATLLQTQGGRNLSRIGFAQDIETVARIDLFSIVPELNLDCWQITATASP
ncbi:MAG: 2-phosphosulfolactate phosphatase [Planctomycetota bacterium]|nr:2-phosphosulfolactate phosphatase [Planctomycetota bacterium]